MLDVLNSVWSVNLHLCSMIILLEDFPELVVVILCFLIFGKISLLTFFFSFLWYRSVFFKSLFWKEPFSVSLAKPRYFSGFFCQWVCFGGGKGAVSLLIIWFSLSYRTLNPPPRSTYFSFFLLHIIAKKHFFSFCLFLPLLQKRDYPSK